MEQETWKDIIGYEGRYQISNLGNVKSLNYKRSGKQKLLITQKNGRGYLHVGLPKNKKCKSFVVHRLVALSFIPNPLNLICVNHINGIKTDNRIANLEWVTYKENTQHAFRTGLSKSSDKAKLKRIEAVQINVIDLKTGIIYASITEASKTINITRQYLSQMLNGKRKNHTNLIKLKTK